MSNPSETICVKVRFKLSVNLYTSHVVNIVIIIIIIVVVVVVIVIIIISLSFLN